MVGILAAALLVLVLAGLVAWAMSVPQTSVTGPAGWRLPPRERAHAIGYVEDRAQRHRGVEIDDVHASVVPAQIAEQCLHIGVGVPRSARMTGPRGRRRCRGAAPPR